jgi:hypothetical protein
LKPVCVKYKVGKDMHQRTVHLTKTEMYGWEIHVEAASQRDEDQRVWCLTDEVILAMAEAVKEAKWRP